MTALPSYFNDFLSGIRLQSTHIDDLKRGHRTLRERLAADKSLAPCIVSTFLQGSYRRATAVRPKSGKRSDVDVVVVTKLSMREYSDPDDAMELFVPFMEKHYKGKYRLQGRSIGIEMSYVDLDLVITAAPSESEEGILKSESVTAQETLEEATDWKLVKSWVSPAQRTGPGSIFKMREAAGEQEWKTAPLWIPNRDGKCWEQTHPLAQIQWTQQKNRACNGHYVNVVKAIKWWRRIKHATPAYPKGYPVEHLVGVCCPDGIASVAEGVTRTLEKMGTDYQWYANLKMAPNVPDHGVAEHNVLARVNGADFADFHGQVCEAAAIARLAYDGTEADISESVARWRQLFGDVFPDAPPDNPNNDDHGGSRGGPGFTPRTQVTEIGRGRFA